MVEKDSEKKVDGVLTPEDIEKQFKEYSVTEFFKKNRQMLGYVGKIRSLTTIIHEGVSNALDSIEDARAQGEILVEIQERPNEHFYVIIQDNGTGVPKSKIGAAFGKLLAGTKFHQLVQKRGQQGLGISFVTAFSQLTTGKPVHVKVGVGDGKVYECDVSIDMSKNEPIISNMQEYSGRFKGVRYEGEFAEVGYNRGEYSPYEYLRRTAIANPHVQITLVEPNKEITVFPRSSKEIPAKGKKILPHPLGITTSDLMDMSRRSEARKISSFLSSEFSRVSSDKVRELQEMMPKDESGKPLIDFNRAPRTLQWPEAELIVNAMKKIKWIGPETESLVPIGEKHVEKSLKALLQPDALKVVERKPKVFRGGIPFLVEAAIAYGGKAGVEVNGNRKLEVLRFANRTPLLFDAGTCAITEAVKTIDWNRYDLNNYEDQPMSIFVNFTSVYVPYTGAGKLSISPEEEIVEEIRLALMECAREISQYIHGEKRKQLQEQRRDLFYRYIDEVAGVLHKLVGKEKELIARKLKKMAEVRTSMEVTPEELESESEKELERLEKTLEAEE